MVFGVMVWEQLLLQVLVGVAELPWCSSVHSSSHWGKQIERLALREYSSNTNLGASEDTENDIPTLIPEIFACAAKSVSAGWIRGDAWAWRGSVLNRHLQPSSRQCQACELLRRLAAFTRA